MGDSIENAAIQPELDSFAEVEENLSIWAKSQVELAEHLGCDRKTIGRWLKAKDPACPGKSSDGRYNVTLWKLWASSQGKKPALMKTSDKVSLDNQNMRLRNEKLEIENAIRRGDLLDVDEVCKVITEMVAGFVKRARSSKHTLAPQVIGLNVAEATKRIGKETDEALNELALGEWAKKKPFWSSVFATLSDQRKRFNLGDGLSDT